MTEYHRPVDRANILAHALMDSQKRREYEVGGRITTFAEWEIEQEGLSCSLMRICNSHGSSFSLSVYTADTSHEVAIEEDDEDFDEFDRLDIGLAHEDNEPGPVEMYQLSLFSPQTIKKTDDMGTLFVNEKEVRNRVLWLLEQGQINPDVLQAKEEEDRKFWRVVGSCALSDSRAEELLVKRVTTKYAIKAALATRSLLKLVNTSDYGLSQGEIYQAMDAFYSSSYGKDAIERSRLQRDS